METKLEGWKLKTLSQAGRKMLIRTVANTIPTYTMSTFLLPKILCKILHTNFKNFWWGFPKDKSHNLTLKSWKFICQPKKLGGLGIKQMTNVNKALLTKTGSEVSEKNNGLWYKILVAKYLRHTNFWQATQNQSDSYFWKGILQTRETLSKGRCIQINNGANTSLWDSPWIPTLSNFKPKPLQGMDQAHPEMKVSEIITGNPKQWDLGKMQTLFDRESNHEIQKIQIPTFSQLQDKMI